MAGTHFSCFSCSCLLIQYTSTFTIHLIVFLLFYHLISSFGRRETFLYSFWQEHHSTTSHSSLSRTSQIWNLSVSKSLQHLGIFLTATYYLLMLVLWELLFLSSFFFLHFLYFHLKLNWSCWTSLQLSTHPTPAVVGSEVYLCNCNLMQNNF